MSIRDHRNKATGKKFRRMPKPNEASLGTRIHESDKYDEEIPEIERCEWCEQLNEVEELISYKDEEGTSWLICFNCHEQAENEDNETEDI
jgi:hypothetical protein